MLFFAASQAVVEVVDTLCAATSGGATTSLGNADTFMVGSASSMNCTFLLPGYGSEHHFIREIGEVVIISHLHSVTLPHPISGFAMCESRS